MTNGFQFGGKRVVDVDTHEKHKSPYCWGPTKHEVSLVCVARSSGAIMLVVPILTMLRS